MAVVEHVPLHLLTGQGQAQRAGGRHAQVSHGLAAQKFAHRRAQHGQAVGRSRIGGRAGPFQLQHPAPGMAIHDLAQIDGPSVAQLPGPVAELMTAVAHGKGLHARQQPVAGEHLGKRIGFAGLRRKTQQIGHLP